MYPRAKPLPAATVFAFTSPITTAIVKFTLARYENVICYGMLTTPIGDKHPTWYIIDPGR